MGKVALEYSAVAFLGSPCSALLCGDSSAIGCLGQPETGLPDAFPCSDVDQRVLAACHVDVVLFIISLEHIRSRACCRFVAWSILALPERPHTPART